MVRKRGLEPPRPIRTLDPQSSASTNSATFAKRYITTHILCRNTLLFCNSFLVVYLIQYSETLQGIESITIHIFILNINGL